MHAKDEYGGGEDGEGGVAKDGVYRAELQTDPLIILELFIE